MIESTEIFIPVPKSRNTQCKVLVNGDDLVSKVVSSRWSKILNCGIGIFNIKLSNAGGQISDRYSKGQIVKFYADNNDGSTLQFCGRIDTVKDVLKKDGQWIEIHGRHKGFLSTETYVNYDSDDEEVSVVLKNVIDKFLKNFGFTYNNVNITGKKITRKWDYILFWDFFKELCDYAGFDGYLDDDLDIHFFKSNSIKNDGEAIAEMDNYLDTDEFGSDDAYKKTRCTVVGKDNAGFPVVYTHIDSDEDPDEEIRELFIKDGSANTVEKARDLAIASLQESNNQPPRGRIKSFGLETLAPGDNIWIAIPRKKIYGQYKAHQIDHLFGMKVGGWRTETTFEKDLVDTGKNIELTWKRSQTSTEADNSNKLLYSFNLVFDNDDFSESNNNTKVSGGSLIISNDSGVEGTWISKVHNSPLTATKVEMRVSGKDLEFSKFFYSLNNGVTWSEITSFRTLSELQAGSQIKIKVNLVRTVKQSNYTYNPEVYGLVLLYE